MKVPTASHTMLSDFENCAHKGFRKYISKDLPKGEQTDAMRWGQELHKAMHARISRGVPLPEKMQQFEPLVAPFIPHKPLSELPLALTKTGKPCGFYDGDENGAVFVRGYADVVLIKDTSAAIFDWKTGKKREDPAELKLHAMMLQASYPRLTHIVGHYVWLQEMQVGKQHDLSDTHITWAKLDETMAGIRFMLEQNNFPKSPNPLCGWCPVMDCIHNPNKAPQ